MKARKRNIFKPICLLLIASMLAVAASAIALMNRSHPDEVDELGRRMDAWVGQINTRGTEAFIESGFPADFQMPDGGNLVLLDERGKLLYRSDDSFIGSAGAMMVMLSPYSSIRLSWEGGGHNDYADSRLALLTDAQGNITATLRCVGSGDAPNAGAGAPRYREYFPALNPNDYDDAINYLNGNWGEYARFWSALAAREADGADEAAASIPPLRGGDFGDDPPDLGDEQPPDAAAAKAAYDYARWENAQIARAGSARLIYRGPTWEGTQILLIYPDGDLMHRSQVLSDRDWRLANGLLTALCALALLTVLALAGWVYLDALHRDFRPALWGILALIGNVVAWLVYMLVRPSGRIAKGCPDCGAAIRGRDAYCAQCGTQLCETCAKCGKVMEPEFRYCPGCGLPAAPTAEAPTVED